MGCLVNGCKWGIEKSDCEWEGHESMVGAGVDPSGSRTFHEGLPGGGKGPFFVSFFWWSIMVHPSHNGNPNPPTSNGPNGYKFPVVQWIDSPHIFRGNSETATDRGWQQPFEALECRRPKPSQGASWMGLMVYRKGGSLLMPWSNVIIYLYILYKYIYIYTGMCKNPWIYVS